jgi:hypothetical protein
LGIGYSACDVRVVALTPDQRRAWGAVGGLESWSRTPDRTARTENGRKAFRDKFEDLVDPDKVLTDAERAWRAERARLAHFKRMALKSAEVRRRRKEIAP